MDTNLQAKLEQNKVDIEKLKEEQIRLEKEIKKVNLPKIVNVYTFRASIASKSVGYPFTLGVVRYSTDPWNGIANHNIQEQTSNYNMWEVKEIIVGLQRLVDFVENR